MVRTGMRMGWKGQLAGGAVMSAFLRPRLLRKSSNSRS